MKDKSLTFNNLDGQFDDPEDDNDDEKSDQIIPSNMGNQNIEDVKGKYKLFDNMNKKLYRNISIIPKYNNQMNVDHRKVNQVDVLNKEGNKNETNTMIQNGNSIATSKSNERLLPYHTMTPSKPISFVNHIVQFAQKNIPGLSTFSRTNSSFHSSTNKLPIENETNFQQRPIDTLLQIDNEMKSPTHLQQSQQQQQEQKQKQVQIQQLQKSQWQHTDPTQLEIDLTSKFSTIKKEIQTFALASNTNKTNIHNYNINSKPIIDSPLSESSSLKKNNVGSDSFIILNGEKENDGEKNEVTDETGYGSLSSNFSTFIRPFSSPESSTMNASRKYISIDSSQTQNEPTSSISELICTEHIKNKDSTAVESAQHLSYQALSTTSLPNPPNICYAGSIPLGLEQDKYWLSELHCYLRSNFAEVFAAKPEDITGKQIEINYRYFHV